MRTRRAVRVRNCRVRRDRTPVNLWEMSMSNTPTQRRMKPLDENVPESPKSELKGSFVNDERKRSREKTRSSALVSLTGTTSASAFGKAENPLGFNSAAYVMLAS